MLKHKGTKIIKTEKLVLRRFKNEDLSDIYKNWASDKRVTCLLGCEPQHNIMETNQVLSSWIDDYKERFIYNWAIEFDGIVIGNINVAGFDDENDYAELGFCLGYDYWSKGIMSETVKAVSAFLLNEVGFNKLIITCDKSNIASSKVAEKCGFSLDGIMRQHQKTLDGKFYDVCIYSLLKEDLR